MGGNMDGQLLKDTIQMIVFLLPVLALVWKASQLASKVNQIEEDVREKTMKFCKDHTNMAEKIEQERIATDSSIASIMATLTEIQKSLVRVETKLDIEDKRK